MLWCIYEQLALTDQTRVLTTVEIHLEQQKSRCDGTNQLFKDGSEVSVSSSEGWMEQAHSLLGFICGCVKIIQQDFTVCLWDRHVHLKKNYIMKKLYVLCQSFQKAQLILHRFFTQSEIFQVYKTCPFDDYGLMK